MVSVLVDAGWTHINPSGPPCLPSRPHNFRAHLIRLFSSSDNSPAVRSDFLVAFSAYIQSPQISAGGLGRKKIAVSWFGFELVGLVCFGFDDDGVLGLGLGLVCFWRRKVSGAPLHLPHGRLM